MESSASVILFRLFLLFARFFANVTVPAILLFLSSCIFPARAIFRKAFPLKMALVSFSVSEQIIYPNFTGAKRPSARCLHGPPGWKRNFLQCLSGHVDETVQVCQPHLQSLSYLFLCKEIIQLFLFLR